MTYATAPAEGLERPAPVIQPRLDTG